ncbi:permease [Paenibacillus sp. MMO-58]|uniref:permease n=1 Tax=Paenibacillus sp. MMO-58 TaxID=3081290 RepID=UPI003015DEEF
MNQKSLLSWRMEYTYIIALALIVGIGLHPEWLSTEVWFNSARISTFKTMLISIVLETLPFLLLGVAVSSLMHVFIPEAWIRRFIPKNPLLGILIACLLGILFPVCECGLIPVVRRLMAKGMPLYVGVAFILAGPIVNPIVYSATYVAFRNRLEMVNARMGLAVVVALIIALIVYFFVKSNPMKTAEDTMNASNPLKVLRVTKKTGKFSEAIRHAGGEFFDMGKYVIFGSILAALIQSFIPRSELLVVGQGEYTSHLFMMGFAFFLSLCSTSDAFVASSFLGTFSASSLLTFMVFGPMIDMKGTLMLLSIFKARFVVLIIALLVIIVPVGSMLVQKLFW